VRHALSYRRSIWKKAAPGNRTTRIIAGNGGSLHRSISSLFDELVRDGRMPQAKIINTRNVWDRLALDMAFDELPEKDKAAVDNDDWNVAV
jgi:hypothetical protein